VDPYQTTYKKKIREDNRKTQNNTNMKNVFFSMLTTSQPDKIFSQGSPKNDIRP